MIHKITSNLSRGMRHFMTGQGGFTLIELLVVVIILGVLAAVVTVNVARFANQGQTEASNTEADNIQLAIDALIADQRLAVVTAHLGVANTGVVDFASTAATPSDFDPSGATAYLFPNWTRTNPTSMAYCWNADGLVVQVAVGGSCPAAIP